MIQKLDQMLTVLYKFEIHAFVLLLTGVALYLHGVKDQGQMKLAPPFWFSRVSKRSRRGLTLQAAIEGWPSPKAGPSIQYGATKERS